MKKTETLTHGFPPFYTPDSRLLILGSFPSVKSREQQFYYGHPQNRFWKVLGAVYGCDPPDTLFEKREFLAKNKIALWDVVEKCDISGSSDSSIKNVRPTELLRLSEQCPIELVILNGRTAERLFEKFFPDFPIEHRTAPSTSPANAAFGLGRLIEEWTRAIKQQ